MRGVLLLPILALVLAACGPKTGAGTGTGADPVLEPLPADAVLWEGESPADVPASAILEKVGFLRRTKPPPTDVDRARWWPFSLDYWGVTRTDLETLLAPHVGRKVRVIGHYKKIYDDGEWIYEVDPVRIIALADGTDTE